MKKIIVLLLTLVLAFFMCACEQGVKTLEKLENIELPPLPAATEDAVPTEEVPEELVVSADDADIPEEADEAATVSYEVPELGDRVIVNISEVSREEYDPQNGEQLILTFSYETPHVTIQDRNDTAQAINEYIAMLDETYYTGNDYGAGTALGFNAMLEFAQDNYAYAVGSGEDVNLEFVASRSVTVGRADDTVLSLIYDDYVYTGGQSGQTVSKGYVFDTQTGERLVLADLTKDYEAFRTFLVEYLVTDGEGSGAESTRAEYEEIVNNLLDNGSWYFTNDSLVILSSEPEAEGALQNISLLYSEVNNVIDEKWQHWTPATKGGTGRFDIARMSDIEDGTVEIIDLVAVGEEGDEFCLKADGTVYDVKISSVHYTDAFYETAQLWYASHMSNCAVQLQVPLPDGMPVIMISYFSGQKQHNILLTHNEDGGPALADDSIEAVG